MAFTSFYDQFDSPDIMAALLGITPSGAGPKPDQVPQPPMTVMDRGAPAGPSYADWTTQGGGQFGGAPAPGAPGIGSDLAAGAPPGAALGTGGVGSDIVAGGRPAPPPQPDMLKPGGIGSDFSAGAPPGAALGMGGVGSDAVASGLPPGGIPGAVETWDRSPARVGGIGSDARFPTTGAPPMPPPRPPMPPQAAIPPAAAPTAGPAPPMAPPAAGPPPAAGARPPGFGPGLPPMPQAQMGGRILGLDRRALAGALTAAGNSSGKSGFQAFTSGAGAALSAQDQGDEKQFDRMMKVRKQAFDESNHAFDNMIKAANEKNSEGVRKAQAEYFTQRAKSMAATPGGSKAWQTTPFGQMNLIEARGNAWFDSRRKTLDGQFKLNGTPEAQQKEEIAKLEKAAEAYKQNLYGMAGINPQAQQKLKTLGMTDTNPFEPQNAQELHQMVPPGGWFKDPGSGKVMRFTKPQYEKFGPTQSGSGTATTQDDLDAMAQ